MESTSVLLSLDKIQWNEVYSGNPTSSQTATYIFLCTKIGANVKLDNREGKSEGCYMKYDRDFYGSEGCCDCCGEDECGLSLAAVTVDESVGGLVGFSEAVRGLIWSASMDFEKVSTGCCSYETVPVFRSAYNMAHYAPELVSTAYQRGYRDEFQLVNKYGESRLVDKEREYLHYKKANGTVCSLVNDPDDYYDSGGIKSILRRALFRWKYKEALSIGKFLELVGKVGEIDRKSGYLMVPKTYGFLGLWSKGYNCVSFCESFLNKCELIRERTGWFLGHKRKDLLKHILLSEKLHGFCVVAHKIEDFVHPPAISYNTFSLIDSLNVGCNPTMFRDKNMPVFLLSDFK